MGSTSDRGWSATFPFGRVTNWESGRITVDARGVGVAVVVEIPPADADEVRAILGRQDHDPIDIPPIRRLPISAPRWVWAMYLIGMVVIALFATAGGLVGLVAVLGGGGFSFQFWVYAVHRGLWRRQHRG